MVRHFEELCVSIKTFKYKPLAVKSGTFNLYKIQGHNIYYNHS